MITPEARTDTGEAVRTRLALTRAAYAELLACARAAVAAERDHAPDPLAYVRGVLAEHGQLPPDGMRPAQLLALSPMGGRP
jgi:hypothetical protein